MKPTQLTIGMVGIVAGVYGVVLLMERPEDLLAVGTWLIGGVVLHDALLAPVVVGLCVVGARLLPSTLRAPAAVSLTIFGSLTLISIPVLGRFGAKADNPSLLDRNYVLGWLLLGALTFAGALLAGELTRRSASAIRVGEDTEVDTEEV